MSNQYVPLCTMGDGTIIWTDKSFWRWYHKPTTDGQISKLMYLIYNYNIEVTVPSKCGHTSNKISKIENAIKLGKVTPRKNKNGHIESKGRTLKFIPMQKVKKQA